MKIRSLRVRSLALIAVTGLAACALPRSGPTKNEILSSAIEKQGDAHIVEVDTRVARATAALPAPGFTAEFVNAGVVGSDLVRPGDTLGLTIWENVDDGLLSSQGQNATALTEVQVDGAGFIFVPYAGRLRASGNTPEALRRIITEKLNEQTPDPQVTVSRIAGDGATVAVMGNVGGQGVYAIERPTRTLSSMIARAGGVSIPPEIAQITVTRGQRVGRVWLKDLYTDPQMDIAIRPGDVILVEEDTRSFTALGATGGQSRVPFETQTITAIEALAQVGGLASSLADPKGIFVFREEEPHIANSVLNRTDIAGPQRMVYVLNLTEPSGVFIARDFDIRDGDTVYVTEAPFVRWQKTLSALTGGLTTANTIDSIANGD